MGSTRQPVKSVHFILFYFFQWIWGLTGRISQPLQLQLETFFFFISVSCKPPNFMQVIKKQWSGLQNISIHQKKGNRYKDLFSFIFQICFNFMNLESAKKKKMESQVSCSVDTGHKANLNFIYLKIWEYFASSYIRQGLQWKVSLEMTQRKAILKTSSRVS